MAAFSHQHQQFLDCDFLSNNTNIKMSDFEEICFDYYPSCVIVPQISSCGKIPVNMDFENSRKMSVHEGQMGLIDGGELVRQCSNGGGIRSKQEVDSFVVEHGDDDHVIQQSLVENKRKNCNGYMLNSSQFKETKECKGKKSNSCRSLKKTEVKKLKTGKKKQRKICENPPSGYIQVRARRGEATDSHSLAERVRREKISQRMKLLQGLVPGCDKVTGKALMLDEIINYVQSLQNQVEILSMKLASVNPLLYDFGLVWEDYMVDSEKLRSSNPPALTLQQSEYEQVAAFVNPTAFPTTSNYPLLDSPSFLPSDQTSISFSQDNHNLCWNVDDQKQRFMDQDCF